MRKRRNSRPMPRRHLGEHLAGSDVQCGVQVGGAVADVVVAAPLGHAGHQRQDRRASVERLDLRLLVDAEHDRGLRRVEVEADDVPDLVYELWIRGKLERLRLVRLEPERPPDPADRRLRHASGRRHRAGRPVGRAGRLLLERLHDHPPHVLVCDRARLARTRLVMQTTKAASGKPPPPFTDRVVVAAQLDGDLFARATLRSRQHDPAAKRERLRTLRTPSPPLKDSALLVCQHHLGTSRHNSPQSSSMTRTTSATATGSLSTTDSRH